MSNLVARLFLKYSPTLSRLRALPGFGAVTHRISHRLLSPDQLIWTQVQKGPGQGLWLKLHPRTGRVYCDGDVEPELQQVLAGYLMPGMVFYDLGANLGFFSLLAARAVGPSGEIFAVEADPEMAGRLTEHLTKNQVENARVIASAVWSWNGSVQFSRADSSLSPEHGTGKVVSPAEHAQNTLAIPCITLDEFIETAPPPDFIKCDVEDAELKVFAGAQKVLSQHRPLVACEVHSDQIRTQLTGLFSRLDYSLSWFTPNHMLATPG
jgi:FkbM family methyltransferase